MLRVPPEVLMLVMGLIGAAMMVARHHDVAKFWDALKEILGTVWAIMTLRALHPTAHRAIDRAVVRASTPEGHAQFCAFCGGEGHDVADCTVLEVWCTCGSTKPSETVEVDWDGPGGDAPEVVNRLCPDCHEKRTPKQVRTEEEWAARKAKAAADLLEVLDDDGAIMLDQCTIAYVQQRVLGTLMKRAGELTEQWDDDGGAFVLTKEQSDQYVALVGQIGEVKAYLDKRIRFENAYTVAVEERVTPMLSQPSGYVTTRGAYSPVPGSVPPEPPVEVEQDGYIYALRWWHNLCDDDDHDWEEVRVASQWDPVDQWCSKCGVHRRPVPRKPDPILAPEPLALQPPAILGETWPSILDYSEDTAGKVQ